MNGDRIPDFSDFSLYGGILSSTAERELARVREGLGHLFEVRQVIGEGSMAVVFDATRQLSGQRVALKVLKLELQNQAGGPYYFRREVRNVIELVHPNILPILGVGGKGDFNWFATRLIEQGNLRRFAGGKPLPNATAFNLAQQIASALEFSHSRGIVHRDVKPTNILMESEQAFLGDFGLSRSLLEYKVINSGDGLIAGTPQYQAPNALRGCFGDTRDDVYSFGALLHELLTGQPPFTSKTRAEVLMEMEASQRPSIVELNPKADAGLAMIAEAAMSMELEDRYAGMSYVLRDIRRAASGERPVGPHKRFVGRSPVTRPQDMELVSF